MCILISFNRCCKGDFWCLTGWEGAKVTRIECAMVTSTVSQNPSNTIFPHKTHMAHGYTGRASGAGSGIGWTLRYIYYIMNQRNAMVLSKYVVVRLSLTCFCRITAIMTCVHFVMHTMRSMIYVCIPWDPWYMYLRYCITTGNGKAASWVWSCTNGQWGWTVHWIHIRNDKQANAHCAHSGGLPPLCCFHPQGVWFYYRELLRVYHHVVEYVCTKRLWYRWCFNALPLLGVHYMYNIHLQCTIHILSIQA